MRKTTMGNSLNRTMSKIMIGYALIRVEGAWAKWLWERPSATLSAEDFARLRHESSGAQKDQVLKSDGPIARLVPRRISF